MFLYVKRAPVLTLWAAVVAEQLGYSRNTALTLGRATGGSTARLKVRIIGRENWKSVASDTPRLCEEPATALGIPARQDESRFCLMSTASYVPHSALCRSQAPVPDLRV